MLSSPRVAVIGKQIDSYKRLFEAVGELFGMTFLFAGSTDTEPHAAAVLLNASRNDAIRYSKLGRRCLAFVGSPDAPSRALKRIEFSDAPQLDPVLRGASLIDETELAIGSFAVEANDQIIARSQDQSLWLRPGEAPSAEVVAVHPPVLGDTDYFYPRFLPNNWFSLLPLLHFARQISGWKLPLLRACFMFDDPNLHWSSYGYVNYQAIAEDADDHEYHVSFATVPLDGWLVHSATARLFREHNRRLSLLVHGNNHTHHELAQSLSTHERLAMALQAMSRIDQVETRAGITIPRIVAAPHGACSNDTAEALLRVGFEAACISRSSIMARNPTLKWPAFAGLRPAEFLGGGLPVIPRFSLQPDPTVRVRLAALLGQPIIPAGHHTDLANGLGLLRERAQLINSLGTVKWMDMQSIAEGNYWTRQQDRLLHVRMYARSVSLQLPPDVTHVSIERPWMSGCQEEAIRIDHDSRPGASSTYLGAHCIPVTGGQLLRIRSVLPSVVTAKDVSMPKTPFRAVVRRHLCEIRDRLTPALKSIARRQNT